MDWQLVAAQAAVELIEWAIQQLPLALVLLLTVGQLRPLQRRRGHQSMSVVASVQPELLVQAAVELAQPVALVAVELAAVELAKSLLQMRQGHQHSLASKITRLWVPQRLQRAVVNPAQVELELLKMDWEPVVARAAVELALLVTLQVQHAVAPLLWVPRQALLALLVAQLFSRLLLELLLAVGSPHLCPRRKQPYYQHSLASNSTTQPCFLVC